MGWIENVIFQSRVQCGTAQYGLCSQREPSALHEAGTDQARELGRCGRVRVVRGGELVGVGVGVGGSIQSLQTRVMKSGLCEACFAFRVVS